MILQIESGRFCVIIKFKWMTTRKGCDCRLCVFHCETRKMQTFDWVLCNMTFFVGRKIWKHFEFMLRCSTSAKYLCDTTSFVVELKCFRCLSTPIIFRNNFFFIKFVLCRNQLSHLYCCGDYTSVLGLLKKTFDFSYKCFLFKSLPDKKMTSSPFPWIHNFVN